MSRVLVGSVAIALVTLAVACGDPPRSESLEAKITRAEAMTPDDRRLAEIYARSCRACHVRPDSGAPLTGDTEAWNVRFAQSPATIAAHTRDGLRTMPPRGQCFDCSDADLWQLTLFMARREGRP
jgi:cytochrome c5